MKFTVKQKFMYGGMRETKNPEYVIYTLLDNDLNKFTLISNIKIENLAKGKMVEAEIDFTFKSERFELKNEEKAKYVETVQKFLVSINPCED